MLSMIFALQEITKSLGPQKRGRNSSVHVASAPSFYSAHNQAAHVFLKNAGTFAMTSSRGRQDVILNLSLLPLSLLPMMAPFCDNCDSRSSMAESDELKSRNLVVCIDGTSNQFGEQNTNVIELYKQLVGDERQLTYYNSGVGTFASHRGRGVRIRAAISQLLEIILAKKISEIVQGAYRWLSAHYRLYDRIYLFGFSRGAYAVRMLAAMIDKVGLIRRGNEEQIPFAYAIYKDLDTDPASAHEPGVPRTIFKNIDNKPSSAEVFKETFSTKAPVHFVGVWDTVSSIGLVRRDLHPGTDNPHTACYFRHALALDERRVKFLPEYARGGKMLPPGVDLPDDSVKEVWFSGAHSDIGGGNVENLSLDNSPAPLVWMLSAANKAGVRIRNHIEDFEKWSNSCKVHESLTWKWKLAEYLPIKRRSYAEKDSFTRRCHRGKGRILQPGQRIHISVALCLHDRPPRATLPEGLCWKDLETTAPLQGSWVKMIDVDSFSVKALVSKIVEPGQDLRRCLQLLDVMTSFPAGIECLRQDPMAVLELYRGMKQGYKYQDVANAVEPVFRKIGKVNADQLEREGLISPMHKMILETIRNPTGVEIVVMFLHRHDLMLPSFTASIYQDVLSCISLDDVNVDREVRCGSIKILTMAVEGDDTSMRHQVARKAGGSLLRLLNEGKAWGDDFDVIHILLEKLIKHDESCIDAFGNVLLLLKLFKEATTSGNEVISDHCLRIFVALSSCERGGRTLIEQGQRLLRYTIINENKVLMTVYGLHHYLLKLMAHGTTKVAGRCISLIKQLIIFEDTRNHIIDDEYLSSLYATVLKRDEATIREELFTFMEDTVSKWKLKS